MRVPFFDPSRQTAAIADELREACARVIASGTFIGGEEVESFERECAEYLGVRHAIGVSSGTDALVLSLLALGIGPGDDVIVPAFTFVATAAAVAMVGATPVFADVDPVTLTLDPESVARVMTDETEAVIPVHIFGRCADVYGIERVTSEHVHVIEDTAQAMGSNDGMLMAGTPGVAGCFSFFPTKNLGGYGDGGMVVTRSDVIAERIRSLRNHGSRARYVHERVGTTARLDAMQAAMLRVKLPRLDGYIAKRREHAAAYCDALGLPSPPNGYSCNQFVIRVKGGRRDMVRAFLGAAGIGTEVYYPTPLHLQPCFAHICRWEGNFPNAELAAKEVLALPIFPELTADEIRYVAETLKSAESLFC